MREPAVAGQAQDVLLEITSVPGVVLVVGPYDAAGRECASSPDQETGDQQHTGRAADALLRHRDGDAVGPDDLLRRFRTSGGAVRFSAVGPEKPLSPRGQAAVRTLLREAMAGADGSESLSVSLTWSPQQLDLLVVLAPRRERVSPGTTSLAAEQLAGSRDLAWAAGGTLRIETLRAGGCVIAVTLPVPGPTGARIAR